MIDTATLDCGRIHASRRGVSCSSLEILKASICGRMILAGDAERVMARAIERDGYKLDVGHFLRRWERGRGRASRLVVDDERSEMSKGWTVSSVLAVESLSENAAATESLP